MSYFRVETVNGVEFFRKQLYYQYRTKVLLRTILSTICLLVGVLAWAVWLGPNVTVHQYRQMFYVTGAGYVWLKFGAPIPRIRRKMPEMEADAQSRFPGQPKSALSHFDKEQ